MKSMGRLVISIGMASQACAVTRNDNFTRMRVVAVAAFYTPPEHFALKKRSVIIIFVINLSVSVEKLDVWNLRNVIVHYFLAVDVFRAYLSYSSMTRGASVDLFQLPRIFAQFHKASCDFISRFVIGAVEVCQMFLSSAMATFAAYIDDAVTGFIGIGFGVVIFVQVGRMAGRAHRIPVLGISCPMQPIV